MRLYFGITFTKVVFTHHDIGSTLESAHREVQNMATIMEGTADGIVYRAPTTYAIPDLDVLSLLFGMSVVVNGV